MNAPLLIVNGRPWSGRTLDGDAVLVHDGRIVAVGPRPKLRDERAIQNVVDAHGGTITPGLVDAHIHLVPWARARRQPDLHGCDSRDAALERVRAALAGATGAPAASAAGRSAPSASEAPLVGRGWDDAGWAEPPEAAALDALAPDRPVLLHRHDFHALWVNTAALRAAGVSRDTPDPEAGRFERGPGGEPNGLVREHAVRAFQALEARAAPAVDEALLDEAAATLHAEGITAIHDFQRTQADWECTRALACRRRLRVLQHVGPEQVAEAARLGLRGGEGDAWFRTGALKLFADGTLGSRTAAMLEPYADTGGRGMTLLSRDEMSALIAAAAAAGFSVAIHAIGDAGVRHALDAIEAQRDALVRLPMPPRIEHIQLLHPDDLGRFAALGVGASMQPQHAITDAPVARRAWGARCALAYPWRALLATGVGIAFGSDAPVEPPCARLGLAAAVGRVGADGAVFEPGQTLTLDEALLGYTASACALAAGELGSGRLEPGEPADLVVWDRDLHTAGTAALAQARPRLTALAGEIVYDSRFDARARGGTPGQVARA